MALKTYANEHPKYKKKITNIYGGIKATPSFIKKQFKKSKKPNYKQ